MAENPFNQFCLISHCTLSPTSPPHRREGLCHIVFISSASKASHGGMCLTGTAHTSLPPLSLSCQSVGRQFHCPTVAFILFMFCYRCTLTHSDYEINTQLVPTDGRFSVLRFSVPLLNTLTEVSLLGYRQCVVTELYVVQYANKELT